MDLEQQIRDMKIRFEAEDLFRKRQYGQRLTLQAKLGKLPEKFQKLQDEIEALRNEVKAQSRRDLIFLTVNPKPDVDLEAFKAEVEAIAKRKMFVSGHWCFEQRGQTEDEIGKGVHAHFAMIRDSTYKPSKIAKILSESLLKKGIIGHAKHVDVRQYPVKFLPDKLAYMEGKKWDEGKEPAVKLNKQWRVQNDLKNIYVRSI